MIEQDHRRVKQRVLPMLGFKRFDYAAVTVTGIELVYQIKKDQFNLTGRCSPAARIRHLWAAVLGLPYHRGKI
jgi:transposase-like protein